MALDKMYNDFTGQRALDIWMRIWVALSQGECENDQVNGIRRRWQELDEAARRRMPKQLYIPLPCAAARAAMIERQLGPASGVSTTLSPADVAKIVEKTGGYSGKEAVLVPPTCIFQVYPVLLACMPGRPKYTCPEGVLVWGTWRTMEDERGLMESSRQ